MKVFKTRKRINIIAGMPFMACGLSNNKMHVVSYKIMEFIYDSPAKDCLINEIEVKRVFTY